MAQLKVDEEDGGGGSGENKPPPLPTSVRGSLKSSQPSSPQQVSLPASSPGGEARGAPREERACRMPELFAREMSGVLPRCS